ncbi:MAG: hypothetical protein WBM00_06440 [Solirubrobacterales bacterium]
MKSKLAKIVFAVAAAAALAVAAIVIALGASGGGGSASPAALGGGEAASPSPPGAHLSEQPDEMRTVLVSRGREPSPSPPGPMLHAVRLKGSIPSRQVAGTVLTDEDCSPDAEGVSHCINRLRLAGGRVLVVRHPHRMMDVPCLSPGEHVMVRPA